MKKKVMILIAALLCVVLPLSIIWVVRNHNDQTESDSEAAITDESITAEETTAPFSITTADGGEYTQENNVYTLTHSGTYTLTGGLTGQILVQNTDSTDTADIVIELAGTTIQYDADSPIKIVSTYNDVEISVKKDTDNVIKDTRSTKTVDDETQGGGAIYSKADLKLKGKGTLVITATYNNGVHCTKDLTIKNLSLKVTAYNNAIKGNKSVKITEGGQVVAISTNGDGIKTEDTNKATKGNVTIEAGSVAVYAAGDGIQAARNFYLQNGTDDSGNTTTPTLTIYTRNYSGYTASNSTADSWKGIKAENEIDISAGTLTIKSYDDGLHANYGTAFDDGSTGIGTINISGGTLNIGVYSTETKTAQGNMGPTRPWATTSATGADGIHADYKLTITGGTVNIDSAYEGLEANIITIAGGKSYVAANDDGVNACTLSALSSSTPAIIVTGGYLDVTVSPSGDTDGIDSNGTYTQSGGVVITRGPNSTNMAALDTDGTAKITGGTIIILGALGERGLTHSTVSTYSLSLHSSGNHTVKINGTSYTFNNAYSYGKTLCYSSVAVSA